MATGPAERPAVFLDRDGVLVTDVPDRPPERIGDLLPGVAPAIAELNRCGYTVVVITNQPGVARGVMSEEDVSAQHRRLGELLAAQGASVAGFYMCPHHPHAQLEQYRLLCDCRKPLPGLLHRAARELGLDVGASVMVGDRLTDVETGHRAGCRMSILVETGMHLAPRIVTHAEPLECEPDARVADLPAAVRLICDRLGARVMP